MKAAGYPVPDSSVPSEHSRAFARLGPITQDEEEELAQYLEFVRQRRCSRPAKARLLRFELTRWSVTWSILESRDAGKPKPLASLVRKVAPYVPLKVTLLRGLER